MILVFALAMGLVVGLVVAGWKAQPYRPPELNHAWLAYVAFLPQFLSVYLERTAAIFPVWLISASIVLSYTLLFLFVWLNRSLSGMSILMTGLILNLMVIVLNGGFMPISMETAEELIGEEPMASLEPGSLFGKKDILLSTSDIQLEWLSDRFLLPARLVYQTAFSVGDIFIALGAFWVLAKQSSTNQEY